MKVDTQPFPNVNMVEGYDRSTRHQLDFTLDINMAGHISRSIQGGKKPILAISPKKKKGTILPRNMSGTSGINDQFPLIF
jgi:hypothetical protein